MKKVATLFVVAALVISANTFSFALQGAEYVEFEIHGVTYHVPIPNKETKQDFYYLKKALNGDKEAREMALGGLDRKYFFIGDVGVNRWLLLTKDDVRVITNS